MVKYLNHLDSLKEKYIAEQNAIGSANYQSKQFHYYQDIVYVVDTSISFCQTLRAVKLINTAILFFDPDSNTKVYFTDFDIASIIALIEDYELKEHIIKGLKNVIAKKGLDTISFKVGTKIFSLKGIPFNATFNESFCINPADICINGNDLIALINLVLEKERADRNPKKRFETAAKYIGSNKNS